MKLFNDSSLLLSYLSKDGEEGYPGNLSVDVMYSLSDDNGLKIEYAAITDKATPLNLTNHCYFNLSAGADSTILDHELMLKADKYTPVNKTLIPTGKIDDVKGTPMDFTTSKKIGKDIASVTGGYDHNWVLNRSGNDLELIGFSVSCRIWKIYGSIHHSTRHTILYWQFFRWYIKEYKRRNEICKTCSSLFGNTAFS